MKAIHQFVAGFTHNDAVSNETVVLRDLFRSWGCNSEIFSETKRIPPELRKTVADYTAYMPSPSRDDLVLLHLSTGSPLNDAFRGLKCRKALLYHNITPERYFRLTNSHTAHTLALGRKQARALAETANVNMADSTFNAEELKGMGYKDVRVFPLVIDTAKSNVSPDRKFLRRFDDKLVNVLFVGRCAPNKKIEDALHAFALFQKYIQPASRFIHVGSYAGTERYYYLLLTAAREVGLQNVYFEGCLTQSQLNACYQTADIYLSMSEHEGFCVPLIEAMAANVPVMAYAAGAVEETLNGAGVLFREKEFEIIAEMMGRMVNDNELRSAVLARQKSGIEAYNRRDLSSELAGHLAPLLPGGQ
ncbi:MAG: glycosyltransferase [Kiritimatiellia bacterium]